MKETKKILSIIALFLLALNFISYAESLVFDTGTGRTGVFIGDGWIETAGYSFTLDSEILVTHVGMWDYQNNGLVNEHTFGIWGSSSSPLLSKTISSGPESFSENSFCYVQLETPLVLYPNIRYIMGVTYESGDYSDQFKNHSIFDGNPLPVFHSVCDFGEPLYKRVDSSIGLAKPDTKTSSSDYGYWGPNIKFEVVPEPATLSLFAIGGLALLRKRK